ncbi:hypothetical protein D3C81_2290150 [compost metagenome]
MQELGARCVALVDPIIERRIGVSLLADHKLSAAAQALLDLLQEHSRYQEVSCAQ